MRDITDRYLKVELAHLRQTNVNIHRGWESLRTGHEMPRHRIPAEKRFGQRSIVACLLAEGSVGCVLDGIDLLFHGRHLFLPLLDGGS